MASQRRNWHRPGNRHDQRKDIERGRQAKAPPTEQALQQAAADVAAVRVRVLEEMHEALRSDAAAPRPKGEKLAEGE